MRLLYARIGHPHCPECGREISHLSLDQIVNLIIHNQTQSKHRRLLILAPLVQDRKGEYSQLFANLSKQGYSRVRVDGKLLSLGDGITLIKTNKHTIEVVVDRIVLEKPNKVDKAVQSRLTQSIETALSLGNGYVIAVEVNDASLDFPENPKELVDHLYSEKFACPECNLSLPEIEPRSFSFNSPHGACPTCTGLGSQLKIDEKAIIAKELSVLQGGIIPWASVIEKQTWTRSVVQIMARTQKIDLNKPMKDLSEDHLNMLMHGTGSE